MAIKSGNLLLDLTNRDKIECHVGNISALKKLAKVAGLITSQKSIRQKQIATASIGFLMLCREVF
jgi:hypothetical protein